MGWFETMNWQHDSDPEQEKCISCQKVLIKGKEHTFCKKCDAIPDYGREPTWEDREFAEGASHSAGQGGADAWQDGDGVVEDEEWR